MSSPPPQPAASRFGQSATIALTIIASIAVIATLQLGAPLLIPIALAILLNVVFRPVVRAMERISIPATAGAAIVVFSILAIGVGIVFALNDPVENWIEQQAPQQASRAVAKFDSLRKSFSAMTSKTSSGAASGSSTQSSDEKSPATSEPTIVPATEQTTKPSTSAQEESAISSAVSGRSPTASTTQPQSASQALGGFDASGVVARVLGTTTRLVSMIVTVLMLLFLLLSVGDLFPRKLAMLLPKSADRKIATDVEAGTGEIVMRYVVLLTVINLIQGAIISAAMWMLGMPTPLIWGVFTFVLEFVPYLGGAAMIAILTIAALSTFNSVGHAMIVPLLYATMTTVNSSVIAPITYGRQLKLNPVAILIGVLFWFFLWDVPGAFLAVPILATIKIIADRVPSMRAISVFLSE